MRGPIARPGPGTAVTVLGMARSGLAAAEWLLRVGCRVRVTEKTDSAPLRAQARRLQKMGAIVECGGHTRAFVDGSSLVVASPGVPASADPIRWALSSGIPVVNELDMASWYCSGRIVAVTGSNGKSTVVTLIGQMLTESGLDAIVCGNIGTPLSAVLPRVGPKTRVVLETSSFQLEQNKAFHPEVGVVLNLTDNHLDRHGSFAEYQQAKGRMFAYQTPSEWALLNADQSGSSALEKLAQGQLVWFSRKRPVAGAYFKNGELVLNLGSTNGTVCKINQLYGRGVHHEENALAASCAAALMGASVKACGRVLRSFVGLPHRQQKIAVYRGVTFINDSKATTVAAGICAIEATAGPVILIAGGRDKGSDFTRLQPWVKRLKAAVLIGEDGPKIARCLNGKIPLVQSASMNEAVKKAFELARTGGSVLLSPMCTSFDMFRDFEDRGEKFVEAVKTVTG